MDPRVGRGAKGYVGEMIFSRALLGLLAFLMLTAGVSAAAQTARPAAQQTRSPHGPLAVPCENCHTLTSWKPIRAVPEFDHNKTSYPLRGMHAKVECVDCHTKPVFSNVGAQCSDCHADLHRGQFGANCQQCHTVLGWDVQVQAIREHDNRFPLIGAHAAVDCAACHTGGATGQFRGLSTQCYSCHARDFQSVAVPNHVTAGFSTNCESCHRLNSWIGATFDHSITGFPLTGAHATVACTSCHTNNNYALTAASANCSSCHMPDFQTATNPNHLQGGFSTNCQACHTSVSWNTTTFDHNATGFPLSGAHATAPCIACHVNNNFSLSAANTACSSCHMPNFQSTTSPNHLQANFSTNCQICHTSTTTWDGAVFDHSATGFPLNGAHVTVACISCHVNNNYALTGTNALCSACHLPDFQSTNNPNHVQAAFPTTCETCHTTASWTGANFNHSTTGFPLSGAHVNVACSSCHVNNNYSLTAGNTLCSACHLPDFQSTNNPSHVQASFPTTCDTCHTTTTWTGVTFNHATTGFTLTGAHVNVACSTCHVNNNYALTAANTACSACHLPDYQSTNNPSHSAAGFPTDCTLCHSTTVWTSGTFNHATTGFPLTGTHTTVLCTSCHINNNYNLSSTACVTCHQTDYNNATIPINHIQLGYPTSCDLCHNTVTWSAGTFNHSSTGFTLTGAHTAVACSSCHVNNNYTSLPTDCYSCHKTVYQTTTNPNHVAAGFPTTCQTCHTTTTWSGATFNHTWFPMTHGNAQSVCATCHTNSSDYSVFQCTTCHAATQTNSQHSGVRNYVYNNTNCYQCHPQGTN